MWLLIGTMYAIMIKHPFISMVLLLLLVQVVTPSSFLSATRLSSMFFRNMGTPPSDSLDDMDEEEKGRGRWTPLTPSGADSLTSTHDSSHSLIAPIGTDHYSIQTGGNGEEGIDHYHHDDHAKCHAWMRALYFIPLLSFLIYFAVDR